MVGYAQLYSSQAIDELKGNGIHAERLISIALILIVNTYSSDYRLIRIKQIELVILLLVRYGF